MVNTGAVLSGVGVIITAILTFLGAWFAKRGDRNARLTQRYYDDAEFNLNMVTALRSDYWSVVGMFNAMSTKWHTLIDGLPRVCSGSEEEVRQMVNSIGDLPKLPVPMHVEVERRHMEDRLRHNRQTANTTAEIEGNQ